MLWPLCDSFDHGRQIDDGVTKLGFPFYIENVKIPYYPHNVEPLFVPIQFSVVAAQGSLCGAPKKGIWPRSNSKHRKGTQDCRLRKTHVLAAIA
jgi:hypothetical protein